MHSDDQNAPLDKRAKKWKELFATRRNFEEDDSYVEALKRAHGDGNTLIIFLGDCGGPVPSCRSKEVLEFCEDLDPRSLLREPLEYNCDNARSWLSDSEFNDDVKSIGRSRIYTRRLTDKQLHASLRQPRFGLHNLPNADRRLM
ncbi:hypothetical protein GQ44DRAFT_136628 [Phaeosphaeriaceae sp. PMI808]|nr:hypothetical protein GQ44DRAFT_136628 [Phaeosphaeriaceae sp. PMI808]